MGLPLLLVSILAAAAHAPEVELQRMVDELTPLVEQVAGHTFAQRPVVVLASAEDLGEALRREQIHLLQRRAQLSHAAAERAAARAIDGLAESFVGKYGFLDKRLYVLQGGVDLALSRQGADPALAGPVMEVILAHELTHALQDQRQDLRQVALSPRDGDGVMAANCVVEGHAVWVHEQVGLLRGHPEAVDLVADFHGYQRDSPRLAETQERFYTSYVYGQGRAFVAWHVAHGGTGQIWRILGAPPAHSAMILAPETYAPTAEAAPDPVLEALSRARRALGSRGWSGTDERLGDFHLREYLMERRARPGAGTVLRGWRSRASAPRGMRGIDLRSLTFDSAQAAQAHVHTQRERSDAQLRMLLPPETSPLSQALRGTVEPFDALPADASAREVLRLDLGEGPLHLSTLWIARGPHVLHLTTVDHASPDRRIARILERVFRALE